VVAALLLEAHVVQGDREADRQGAGHQDVVGVERRALVAPGAEAHRGLALGLAQQGFLRGVIDDAGGGTQARERGVRAAVKGHLVEVVGVKTRPVDRVEVIPGRVRRGQSADAVGLVRILGHAIHHLAADACGGVRVLARALGVGGVGDDVIHAHGADVIHELLRHHADRGGDVLQLRVHAASGQGVGGVVASVLGGIDREGRQDDGLLLLAGALRLGRGCRLGLQGAGDKEAGQGEERLTSDVVGLLCLRCGLGCHGCSKGCW